VNFDGGLLKALGGDIPEVPATETEPAIPAIPFYSNPGGAAVCDVIILAGGANIDTNGFDCTIMVPLVEDDLSPGGGLTKLGEGVLTLTEACSYKGDTTVSAGALAVDGSITSDVIVDVGAALMGNGTVLGNVEAAGDVGPGASIGTLTVNGNLKVGGTLDVEYDSDAEQIDLLVVSGNLDLTGATISFSDLGSSGCLGQGAYVFATYGSLVGAPAIEVGVPGNKWVDYAYGGNSIALVPEPSILILLAGLAAVLVGCRRRP